MNRAVDYRSDFYSLGATFYEMLTGEPPFAAEDALALVHCHIARPPVPPASLRPEIPVIVSDIVKKLLEKNAEDRYQSAWGLRADLQECLSRWEKDGAIEPSRWRGTTSPGGSRSRRSSTAATRRSARCSRPSTG